MFKEFFVRGLVVLFSVATLFGIFSALWIVSYRHIENQNFAELRKKGELDCITMPYHCAIKEGSAEKIKALKSEGENINGLDRFGNTPLLYALSWNTSLVGPLLESGADPNIPNEQGLTPLQQSLNLEKYTLAEKLVTHGANPNAKAEGDQKKYLTLLTFFITNENQVAATFLVEHGANIGLKDSYGYDACERVRMYQTEALFPFCTIEKKSNLSIKSDIYTNSSLGIQVMVPAGWKTVPQPQNPEIQSTGISLEMIEKTRDDFGLMQFILDPRIRIQHITLEEWALKNIIKDSLDTSYDFVHLDGVQTVRVQDSLFEKNRYRYFIDMGTKGVMSITFFASPRFDMQYSEILKSLVFTQKEG